MLDKLHLIEMLRAILETKPLDCQKISMFQRLVWDDPGPIHGATPKEDELICDLATDLDYFEPNPQWRAEDPSFYDEARARQEISAVLNAIQ